MGVVDDVVRLFRNRGLGLRLGCGLRGHFLLQGGGLGRLPFRFRQNVQHRLAGGLVGHRAGRLALQRLRRSAGRGFVDGLRAVHHRQAGNFFGRDARCQARQSAVLGR